MTSTSAPSPAFTETVTESAQALVADCADSSASQPAAESFVLNVIPESEHSERAARLISGPLLHFVRAGAGETRGAVSLRDMFALADCEHPQYVVDVLVETVRSHT